MPIEPGLTAEITHVVTENDTAATYGSGLVPVLSTPHLIALMENAAQTALNPYMDPGQSAVGTHLDVRHQAPTPVGMQVRVRAELVAVEGQRLRFHIEAWDAEEQIGTGDHERYLIDVERFMQRVREKAGEA
jgi:predicted thioesterase